MDLFFDKKDSYPYLSRSFIRFTFSKDVPEEYLSYNGNKSIKGFIRYYAKLRMV